MPDNWFHGLIPTPREGATISEAILVTTAAMRKNGTFDTDSLCWSPAELECLAMFAIDSKNKLAQPSAARRDVPQPNLYVKHPDGTYSLHQPKERRDVLEDLVRAKDSPQLNRTSLLDSLIARAENILASSPRDGMNQEKP